MFTLTGMNISRERICGLYIRALTGKVLNLHQKVELPISTSKSREPSNCSEEDRPRRRQWSGTNSFTRYIEHRDIYKRAYTNWMKNFLSFQLLFQGSAYL